MTPSFLSVSPKRVLHCSANLLFPHLFGLASTILPFVQLYARPLYFWILASCCSGFMGCSVDEVEGDYEGGAKDLVGRGRVSAVGGHIAQSVLRRTVCHSFICSLSKARKF